MSDNLVKRSISIARFVTCFTFLVLYWQSQTECRAQDHQLIRQPLNTYALRLYTSTYSVTAGEPLYLLTGIQNASEEPIVFNLGALESVRILVKKEGEQKWQKKEHYQRQGFYPFLPKLRAKAEIKRLDLLQTVLPNHPSLFPQPGRYIIKAKLGSLESIPLTIVVNEPSPQQAQEFLLLTQAKAQKALVDENTSTEKYSLLERFLEQHPDSVFSDHVRYSLGLRYQSIGRNSTQEIAERLESREKVKKYFHAVSGRIPELKALALLGELEFALTQNQVSERLDAKELIRQLDEKVAYLSFEDKKRYRNMRPNIMGINSLDDRSFSPPELELPWSMLP